MGRCSRTRCARSASTSTHTCREPGRAASQARPPATPARPASAAPWPAPVNMARRLVPNVLDALGEDGPPDEDGVRDWLELPETYLKY